MEFQRTRLAARETAGPATRAFQSGRELFPFERLEKIFVAARFDNVEAVDVITAPGHDDDPGQVELFADRAANLEAADFWQEQIAHDRVWPFREGQLDSGLALERLKHIPAMFGEE